MSSSDQSKATILVVEDEPSQLEMLSYNLMMDGYVVIKAETGEDGLMLLEENNIDLVLLDWMLPQTSGIEVCRQIKRNKETANLPVIMLTARGEEEDKIRGLDIGADDYVVKPYSVKELLARVRAALRRKSTGGSTDVFVFDQIEVNLVQHKVSVAGQTLKLGPLEFKLLVTLIKSPGRVYSREQLLDLVWTDSLEVDMRTVDVHIGRLRKQLAKGSDKNFVRTVRGFGYAMDSSEI